MNRGFAFKLATFFYLLTLLFLPTQLGKHFWPDFTVVEGFRIDYLSPTLYFTDLTFLLSVLILAFAVNKNLLRNVKSFFNKHLSVILLLAIDFTGGLLGATDKALWAYFLIKLAELILFAYVTRFFLQVGINAERVVKIFIFGIVLESLL